MSHYYLSTSSNTYSTDETIIGTWIDGKPLYRLVVQANITNSSCSITMSNNIKDVVKMSGIFKQSIGNTVPLPQYTSNTNYEFMYHDVSSNTLVIKTGSGFSTGQAIVFVEYTKTTD